MQRKKSTFLTKFFRKLAFCVRETTYKTIKIIRKKKKIAYSVQKKCLCFSFFNIYSEQILKNAIQKPHKIVLLR